MCWNVQLQVVAYNYDHGTKTILTAQKKEELHTQSILSRNAFADSVGNDEYKYLLSIQIQKATSIHVLIDIIKTNVFCCLTKTCFK